jgi:hypothetical protein
MKIRTADNLSDALSAEFVWRKKELATIRSLIRREKWSSDQKKAIIRSALTVLYAHWEGFVKAAASAYLEFVAMQRLSYQELTPNFIALSMKRQLDEARGTHKASIYNQVAEFFLTRLSERARIPYKDVVDTKSNLSAEIFKEIITMLGLDYPQEPYTAKEQVIDQDLLGNRNVIAHGRYLLIKAEDYFRIHDDIVSLMNYFKNQLQNAAFTEAYRR